MEAAQCPMSHHLPALTPFIINIRGAPAVLTAHVRISSKTTSLSPFEQTHFIKL